MFYLFVLAIPFFSGVLLWDFIGASWEIKRWLLLWHAPISLAALSFYMFPYVLVHVAKYARG